MSGAAALARLNACDDAAFCTKFCHTIVHQLCRGKAVKPDGMQFWSVVEWDSVVKAVGDFFLEACGNGLTEEEATKHLQGNGIVPLLVPCVVEVYMSRRRDVTAELLSRTASIGCGRLVDFDWRVNCTLASDQLATLEMFGVELAVTTEHKAQKKKTVMEMLPGELDTLIGIFEEAVAQVDDLST